MIIVATLAALTCGGALRAHHSISMIDTSTPVWAKGRVVRYEVINPHTMLELEETTGDGQVKRWTVEGPALWRIERMHVDKSFVSVGDVVEVCGFTPKRLLDSANPNAPRPPFVHGHLLVNANGARSPWGSYGKMENCVRPGDDAASWVRFLDVSEFARSLWCNPYRAAAPTIAEASALVDAINRLLPTPCSQAREPP
jgi:hypothetical protein